MVEREKMKLTLVENSRDREFSLTSAWGHLDKEAFVGKLLESWLYAWDYFLQNIGIIWKITYIFKLFKSLIQITYIIKLFKFSYINISTQLFNSTLFYSFLVNPGDPDSGVVTDSGPPASPSLCSPGEKMKHFHDPTFPFWSCLHTISLQAELKSLT